MNWPWNQGIEIVHRHPETGLETVVSFDPQTLAPKLNRPVEVMADEGSTILARVK